MARNIPEHSDQFHDNGLYLPTRTMYIDGEPGEDGFELTSTSIRRDLKNLHILDSIGTGEITVVLNCNGGDTVLGMAIYDAIKACKNFVRVIVKGRAYSMGSIILQAADERVLSPNSSVMIHMGDRTYKENHKYVNSEVKFDEHMDKVHVDIYLEKIKQKKPRFTKDQLQKLLDHGTIFTAKEALDIGLADKILETE